MAVPPSHQAHRVSSVYSLVFLSRTKKQSPSKFWVAEPPLRKMNFYKTIFAAGAVKYTTFSVLLRFSVLLKTNNTKCLFIFEEGENAVRKTEELHTHAKQQSSLAKFSYSSKVSSYTQDLAALLTK